MRSTSDGGQTGRCRSVEEEKADDEGEEHHLQLQQPFVPPHIDQECKVCQDPAAGFHFGAFTCEGCKSFFGRMCKKLPKAEGQDEARKKSGGRGTTTTMSTGGVIRSTADLPTPKLQLPDCRRRAVGDWCDIHGRGRTTCKRCRWDRCVLIGMSRLHSRYGRRSHYFKVSCMIEKKRCKQTPDELTSDYPPKSNPPCATSTLARICRPMAIHLPPPTTTSQPAFGVQFWPPSVPLSLQTMSALHLPPLISDYSTGSAAAAISAFMAAQKLQLQQVFEQYEQQDNQLQKQKGTTANEDEQPLDLSLKRQ